jgi:hypothetical protein
MRSWRGVFRLLSWAGVTSVSSAAVGQTESAGDDGSQDIAWQVGDQGYVTSGDWSGYAWTAVAGNGSTLAPADFTGLAAGERLCITGTVAASPDYSGVAILGLNLNQPPDGSEPGTVVPALEGLLVDVDNPGASELRVEIEGPPSQRWCAPLVGSGFIPFTSFNTECWSDEGEAYAGQPLSTAMIMVPGQDSADVFYDFCLDGLGQTGGPAEFPPPDDGGEEPVVVPTADGSLSVESGYVVAGDWRGYAWSAADDNGSIIEPSDLSSVSGTALCAAGIVEPSEDYDAWAMLGVELNQAEDSDDSAAIVPTSDGLLVEIDNVGGSALRVQIQGAAGATDPDQRWCAPLTGSGVLPWDQFNTECWSGEGTSYAGEPIEVLGIVVPGNNVDPVPFAFCLKNYAEQNQAHPGHHGPWGHRHGHRWHFGDHSNRVRWPAWHPWHPFTSAMPHPFGA